MLLAIGLSAMIVCGVLGLLLLSGVCERGEDIDKD